MKEPILTLDISTKEVMLFSSVSHAQAYIEPYDVFEYEAFDADGMVVEICLDGNAAGFLGNPGIVRLEPSQAREPEKLKDYLQTYLLVRGVGEENLKNSNLDQLVSTLMQVDGATR